MNFHYAHNHHPPRSKRQLELAALRLVVLFGMLAVVVAVLWSHIAWH